ncbi:MAG TPA: urate oxidase [Solirubrobacteraceae bacterium]|nr:urate oxidase [Solirubrobacteraceae bacterium]
MRISYGKLRVPLQRVVKRPDGEYDVLAGEVSIEVLGENFTAAYTEGDNSAVVATDTMKNFILRESLAYEGETLEGLLLHLGRGFLATYPMMEAVRMTGSEHRFDRLSGKLFAREHGDHAVAMVELGEDGIRDHRSGRHDLRLLKVTGSSFTRFARDDYTTLPERVDRPLLIRMDVSWRYGDPEADHVDPWEVREHVAATFDDFVSESIQHLVHEMGLRMLASWPQLAEVSFAAENHTRDPAGADGDRKLYTDPFPAQGLITLTMTR